MPKYVNSFASPEFIQETILDEKRNVVGVLRIKPSSVLWKPRGQQKFYAVSLADFAAWITGASAHARFIAS